MILTRVLLIILLACGPRAAAADDTHNRADFRTGKAAPDSAALARECEYGIAMAFHGDSTRAEQAFLAVLSHAKGDARALNNLGNLLFASGDAELARSYYDLAAKSDGLDAGIALNRAIASWFLGDDEQANRDRDRAAQVAGSEDSLLAMIDLPRNPASTLPPGAAIRAVRRGIRLNEAELRQFLLRASIRIPLAMAAGDSAKRKPGPVKSRMAGSRAGIGLDLMETLYWKR